MNGQSFITSVRNQMNIFLGALIFLTRIPVGKQYVFRSEDLPRSTLYFPMVGLIVGLLGGLVLFCAELFVPPVVAVLLCMGVTMAVTGAIHEDGLADAADGLIGGLEPAAASGDHEGQPARYLRGSGALVLSDGETVLPDGASGERRFYGVLCTGRRPRTGPCSHGRASL